MRISVVPDIAGLLGRLGAGVAGKAVEGGCGLVGERVACRSVAVRSAARRLAWACSGVPASRSTSVLAMSTWAWSVAQEVGETSAAASSSSARAAGNWPPRARIFALAARHRVWASTSSGAAAARVSR